MSREVVCPCCGVRLALDAGDVFTTPFHLDDQRTAEIVIPPTVVADEMGFVVAEGDASNRPAADADPAGDAASAPIAARRDVAPDDFDLNAPPAEESLLATPDPDDAAPSVRAQGMPLSGDTIAWLNLELNELPSRFEHRSEGLTGGFPVDLSTVSVFSTAATHDPPPAEDPERSTGPSFRGPFAPSNASQRRRPRTGIGQVLLLSYASAMTIACLWLVWKLRSRPEVVPPVSEPVRAIRRLAPETPRVERVFTEPRVAPLPPDRVTTLQQPLRVGSLEILPLEVRSTSVTLERRDADGQRVTRDGGGGVLVLRVRLRNTAEDQAFSPLDPAFLRTADGALPDSYVETRDARIYAYPLPVDSPWSVVGQIFRELRPGDSFETIVASDEGALARASDTMTWRLRLRTGPGETDAFGVRFSRDRIQ